MRHHRRRRDRRRRSKAIIHVHIHPIENKLTMIGQQRNPVTNPRNNFHTLENAHTVPKKTMKISQYQQSSSQSHQPIIETDSSIQYLSKAHNLKTISNNQKNGSTFSHKRENAWMKEKGNSMEHHRNPKEKKGKKNCSRLMKILLITAIIVSIIVITVTLSVVLTRPKNVTTPRIAVLRWNTTGITVAGVSDTSGIASNMLNRPFDATLDDQNNIYIADTYNNRIQKYLAGNLHGITVAGNMNGSSSPALSDLTRPSQIVLVVPSNGNFFVADTFNQRIMMWSSGSANGTVIAGLTGVINNTNTTLNYPYAIDYNSASNSLYVSDYSNHRIMHYSVGTTSGTMVAGTGVYGNNMTQLTYPVGIYVDSVSNSLIIANHISHNIVRWPMGATSWTLLAGDISGVRGNSSTLLNYPTRVTLDPMGNLYVADRNNHRIQLFMNGQFEGITIAGATGINGSSSTLLNEPWSIVLDSQLNFYVADSKNHRIQKFLRY